MLYIYQLFHVGHRTAFCINHYSEAELWRSKKKPQTFFSSCTGDTYSAVPQLSAEQLWEDQFSHREGDELLNKIPDSSSAFLKRFSPSTICLYVCKTGKQITWKQMTHWDRQLGLYSMFVHDCGCVSIHYTYSCLCSQYLSPNFIFLLLHIHICAELFLHFIHMLCYNVVYIPEERAEKIYLQYFSTPF